uniref:Uncharacterized protein n=1 Tax=Sinocyclocheilus grahami TaxID=75366 RepID=A0A672JYB3_SINGR
TMDQARTAISKIFNGEPRSYTRFNLTQNMEGDNSHVEMKLSSDMDDEVEANGRSPKTVCGYVIGILFLFVIGKPICWYIQASYVALWNSLF